MHPLSFHIDPKKTVHAIEDMARHTGRVKIHEQPHITKIDTVCESWPHTFGESCYCMSVVIIGGDDSYYYNM